MNDKEAEEATKAELVSYVSILICGSLNMILREMFSASHNKAAAIDDAVKNVKRVVENEMNALLKE